MDLPSYSLAPREQSRCRFSLASNRQIQCFEWIISAFIAREGYLPVFFISHHSLVTFRVPCGGFWAVFFAACFTDLSAMLEHYFHFNSNLFLAIQFVLTQLSSLYFLATS